MKSKYIKIITLYTSLMVLFLLSSSCKPVAKVVLNEVYANATKITGEDKTNFSAYVSIFNSTTGIEVDIKSWSFQVYSENVLLFEVTNVNYQSFEYNVAYSSPPPSYYTNNLLILTIGIPAYNSYVVDQDIFNGTVPDRMDFACVIEDINGNTTDISNSGPIIFKEVDSVVN